MNYLLAHDVQRDLLDGDMAREGGATPCQRHVGGVAPPSYPTGLSTDCMRRAATRTARFGATRGKRGDNAGQIALPSLHESRIGTELLIAVRQRLNDQAARDDRGRLQHGWIQTVLAHRHPAGEQRLDARSSKPRAVVAIVPQVIDSDSGEVVALHGTPHSEVPLQFAKRSVSSRAQANKSLECAQPRG